MKQTMKYGDKFFEEDTSLPSKKGDSKKQKAISPNHELQKDQAMFDIARAMATKDILFMEDMTMVQSDIQIDYKQLDTIESAKNYLKLDNDDEIIKYCNFLYDKFVTCSKKY